MLETFIDFQNSSDPGDMLDSIEHMENAHELARDAIFDLPADEPRLNDFAAKMRVVSDLTATPLGWTPNQISDATTDLIDAAAALDCGVGQ